MAIIVDYLETMLAKTGGIFMTFLPVCYVLCIIYDMLVSHTKSAPMALVVQNAANHSTALILYLIPSSVDLC